jgi:hypothetical protein
MIFSWRLFGCLLDYRGLHSLGKRLGFGFRLEHDGIEPVTFDLWTRTRRSDHVVIESALVGIGRKLFADVFGHMKNKGVRVPSEAFINMSEWLARFVIEVDRNVVGKCFAAVIEVPEDPASFNCYWGVCHKSIHSPALVFDGNTGKRQCLGTFDTVFRGRLVVGELYGRQSLEMRKVDSDVLTTHLSTILTSDCVRRRSRRHRRNHHRHRLRRDVHHHRRLRRGSPWVWLRSR